MGSWEVYLKKVFFILSVFLFILFPRVQGEQIENPGEKKIIPVHPVLEEQTLEKTIDPDEYIMGPGDLLTINLWKQYKTYLLTVTPEGNILIPEVGSASVSGLTLNQAKRVIADNIMKKYKDVDLLVTLVGLRKFKVSVTGAVNLPGVYSAFANARISEIVEKAGGFAEIASQRNIKVIGADGSERKVDILKFLLTGDKSRNPYALDGDVIYVPKREESISTYGIYGAVKAGDEFEYVEGDSLLDLLGLAFGLTMDANLAQAEIVRFGPDNKTTQILSVPLKDLILEGKKESNLELLPDDRVFIRSIPEFHQKRQVLITGEVLYPGVYAIEEGQTRLTDLIKMTGGFTKKASLAEAEMIRGKAADLIDLEFERLKRMGVADMTKTEYEYFKTKAREKPGRVGCDFEKLFGQNDLSQDVLLKGEDIINIPPISLVVKVSGNVVNPGLIEYKPGEDYTYYIDKAGGFSWRARKGKVRIIKGLTSEWVRPSKSKKIDPGDVIWIPEKPDRDYWGFFKDTMIVLGNLATVYLVIKTATE